MGTRYVQWRHCDDSTQFATRGEAGSVQNFLSICSPSRSEHMANNTDEENCGEDIWIYKKPYDKKPPLLWKQISYCWPLTAWNSKGNHHRLSSQCEYFKRRAISSSRRHDFTQSSAKMIFDWIYLNLFIYWNKNTTGKEIANWNVMFGTVAIQMSILDTNFPRFCLANIWTGSNLSVTATWSPKVPYKIYFQLSDREQEATLDRTVVFVILICVFF